MQYDGIGLAFQLGCRIAEDVDFFSSPGFDPGQLRSKLPFFRNLDPPDSNVRACRKRDHMEAFVEVGGVIKVTFSGGLYTLNQSKVCVVPRVCGYTETETELALLPHQLDHASETAATARLVAVPAATTPQLKM